MGTFKLILKCILHYLFRFCDYVKQFYLFQSFAWYFHVCCAFVRESETSGAGWHEAPYINMHPE